MRSGENQRRSNKNVRKTKRAMRASSTHGCDRKIGPIYDHNGRRKRGRWRVNRRKYIRVGRGMVGGSRVSHPLWPTGGVKAMVLKELDKASRSQPAGPGEALGGVAHVEAGRCHPQSRRGEPRRSTSKHGLQRVRLTTGSLEWPHGDGPC